MLFTCFYSICRYALKYIRISYFFSVNLFFSVNYSQVRYIQKYTSAIIAVDDSLINLKWMKCTNSDKRKQSWMERKTSASLVSALQQQTSSRSRVSTLNRFTRLFSTFIVSLDSRLFYRNKLLTSFRPRSQVYRDKCLVSNIQYLAKQRNPYFSHRFYLFIPNFCFLFLFFEKRTVEVTRQFLDVDIWILAKNYLLVKYKVI